jgi:phage-related protein
MRAILLYQTRGGHCPVGEFVSSLSFKQQEKIAWVLKQVREAERVPANYLKKLRGTEGLWEIRAEYRGDAFRLLGFFDGSQLIVLVSGFAKKKERVPLSELRVADERRRDYVRRKGTIDG